MIAGAGFLCVWSLSVKLSGTKIFPSPGAVWAGLAELHRKDVLFAYVRDSLLRVALGYGVAVLLGVPVGLLLGASRLASRVLSPLFQLMRPISPLAWIPISIVLFGVGNKGALFLVFLSAFFPITLSAASALASVPEIYLRAGRNFGLSPFALFARVLLPAALPQILIGLRISLGIAWLVVVAAEMIAVDSGLGYLIIDARNAGKRYDLVVAGILLIGVLGLILDVLVRRTEKLRSVRWGFRSLGRRQSPMTQAKRALTIVVAWMLAITSLHLWLNFDWESFLNEFRSGNDRKLNVAYIPVTCHLACPVTDFISEHSLDGHIFIPKIFQGFPEIKEALISNRMQAAFLVAPLAIALESQGVPIKIVYLGHRYGSSVVVQRDGPVHDVKDLRGRTVAIPSRFSDERLIVLKAMRENGLRPDEVKLVEMAPPDVAGALAVKAIDAFSMAEPFPSQAEMGGYGRVLFQAHEYWPDYISCVLVVRQDLIDQNPKAVQVLVDGIARSGLWLEDGKAHRDYAAEFVGRYYFHQSPEVLRWALTNPVDRVMFEPLSPMRRDFDLVEDLMIESGVLDKKIPFETIVDTQFAEAAKQTTSWVFEAGEMGGR